MQLYIFLFNLFDDTICKVDLITANNLNLKTRGSVGAAYFQPLIFCGYLETKSK